MPRACPRHNSTPAQFTPTLGAWTSTQAICPPLTSTAHTSHLFTFYRHTCMGMFWSCFRIRPCAPRPPLYTHPANCREAPPSSSKIHAAPNTHARARTHTTHNTNMCTHAHRHACSPRTGCVRTTHTTHKHAHTRAGTHARSPHTDTWCPAGPGCAPFWTTAGCCQSSPCTAHACHPATRHPARQ